MLHKTIKDSDLSLDFPAPAVYEERIASRGVIFDDDRKVALLNVSNKFYHKLPGGGVNIGESLVEAFKREAMEEIGCHIGNIQELGIIEEYRNNLSLHQMSHGFTARIVGEKGMPKLEQEEIEEGLQTVWLTLDEAIRTIESEKGVEDYEGKFIQMRDLILLNETKNSASRN